MNNQDANMTILSNTRTRVFFLLINVLFSSLLIGQPWHGAWSVGGVGEEAVLCLEASGGQMWVGGTFSESFSPEGTSYVSKGKRDVWFYRQDESGAIGAAHQIGSEENDELIALKAGTEGSILAFGEFWLTAWFDTTQIQVAKGSKGVYLAAFEDDELSWVQQITGTGIKEGGDMALDSQGGIVVVGYFSDTLFVGDTILTAVGKEDLFVAYWMPTGTLEWAASFGGMGSSRAQSVSVQESGQILIGGTLDGKLFFSQDTLVANTGDKDVFLVALDVSSGGVQWARKAGGVLDDNLTDITVDENGFIWLAGDFTGTLNPGDEQLKLSSLGFPNDAFILRYSSSGIPDFSMRIGGASFDYGTSIEVMNQTVYLAGLFKETLAIGDKSITSTGSNLNGFLVALAWDGTVKALELAGSPVLSFFSVLETTPDGKLFAGGSFLETLKLSGLSTLYSEGGADGFVAEVGTLFTGVHESEEEDFLTIYPNPFSDYLFLDSRDEEELFFLFDLTGRLRRRIVQGGRIPTSDLEPGIYWIQASSAIGIVPAKKIIKY